MHARIDELLSLLDGDPVAAEVAAHVAQCAHCKTESMRLAARRLHLKGLPMSEPAHDPWSQIRAKAASRHHTSTVRWAAVAAAALAVLGLALGLPDADAPEVSQAVQTSPESVPLEELLRRTRELEGALAQLPERPTVERVATAVTIETLQARIQWLDDRLSFVAESRLAEAQAQRLWLERVQLMDSLVKVRYAESGAEYVPGEML
jgi:hypothetical protein